MSEKIKCGSVGVIIGAVVTFATIMITTGSYKEKVDTTATTVGQHETRLNSHDVQISSIYARMQTLDELLKEVRSDIKELLKRTE
jgi:outer membrane murein-binding lipoprotein Lpp